MIPQTDRPRILDVGCGNGLPSLELARLSSGHVVCLDVDGPALEELAQRAGEAGLADRIEAVRCSMLEMDFADETYDIVWAEGSTFVIGFDEALAQWRRLMKRGGHMVIHDMCWLLPDPPEEILRHWLKIYPQMGSIDDYTRMIAAHGYELVGHFPVSKDVWWEEYYGPLESSIAERPRLEPKDAQARATLDRDQREMDLYRKYCDWYGSAFFVMRRPMG